MTGLYCFLRVYKSFRVLFVSLVAICLAGCAFGSKVDYSQVYPQVGSTPAKFVEVMVVDERAYILSGSKTADCVGLIRGSYYIPYDVNTRTGEPLAHDLQQSIIGGIKQSGGEAEPAKPGSTQASSAGRQLMMVRVKKWKSETFVGTVLSYVLVVDLYDEAGRRLGVVAHFRLRGCQRLYGHGQVHPEQPAGRRGRRRGTVRLGHDYRCACG